MRLHLGDCLEVMQSIPDKSVDMVMCDLPYGTTQNKWDIMIPLDPLWAQYDRVCRGAVVLTATQPFTSMLVMSKPKWFRYEWVWEKSSSTGHLNTKRKPMRCHEDILVFSKDTHSYYPQDLMPFNKVVRRGNNGTNFGKSNTSNYQEWTNYPRTILRKPADGVSQHPTQKPVALMEYLIKTYTNPGEVVLDNTMGSGTTGVACVNTGRDFIGIERDEGYFEIAKQRIESAIQIPEWLK